MTQLALSKRVAALGPDRPSPGRRADHGFAAPPPVPVATPLPFSPAADLLSTREHEIALLVARGLSNKEIAIELGISPWTVSAHLRRIFTKLDIGRRIELCLLLMPTPSRRG